MSVYSDAFLIALNNWQKGWNEDQEMRQLKGTELLAQSGAVPDIHRTAFVCFRKRTLLKSEIIDVVGRDCLDEKGPTSWTLTPALVMDPNFKGNYRDGTFGEAVFMHPPAPDEVILNVYSLYQDPDFKACLDSFSRRSPENTNALTRIGNRQHEVILVAPLRGTQIIALSGLPGDFDSILQAHGVNDRETRNRLYQQCVNRSFYPQEAFFMSPEGSQNAVCKLRSIIQAAVYHRNDERRSKSFETTR